MEELEEKDIIDYKKYLRILSKFWYVGLVILTTTFFVAYFKIRYATPIYKVSTTLQLKDKSSYTSNSKNFLEGASMFQPYKNLKNEIELIKSYNRIQLVMKELDFMWEYQIKGSIRNIDIYKKKPFEIVTDSGFVVTNVPVTIKILSEESVLITAAVPSVPLYDPISDKYIDSVSQPMVVERKAKFGENVAFGLFQFKINKTQHFTSGNIDNEFIVIARDLHYLTKLYKSKISISESEKSSIINISSSGAIVEQEVDFLNKLSQVYINKELEEKNRIATNTISFIDSQLNIISDSLKNTEGNIQAFKEKNKMYAIGQEAEATYVQLADLEAKKLELEIQLRYYEYLKEYLNADKEITDLVAPSTINISEGVLNTLVTELIALYQQKNTLKYSNSEKSPQYQTTLIRIKATKEALLETTSNLVKTSRSTIGDLNQRISKLEMEMTKIPSKERNLINIERQHTINDNIYNYLLQKKAEASIARASNLSDAFVVESPREDEFVQIAPVTQKIYMNHLLIGFAISILLVIVYGRLDKKVHNKEEIESLTGVSVLGTIPFSMDLDDKKVHSGHGRITESFRSIRTNLQFLLQGKKTFMIGLTSCISGDGKSFCSENLARAYAISGKKTLLIKGDLRKEINPQDHLVTENYVGLSEYLIGAASLEQIIHQVPDINNLSIILPGPVPPNASELFASAQMEEFLETVKKLFDVVVLDSPPIGLVSDYISVLKYVDVNLYVVRYEYTPKDALEAIKTIKLRQDVNASHTILFNGIKGRMVGPYSYYGYGQTKISEPKWWKRIFNFAQSK